VLAKARRPLSGPPAGENSFDIDVHAIPRIQIDIVELPQMNGFEIALCAAGRPVASTSFPFAQNLKRTMHGYEENIVALNSSAWCAGRFAVTP
jgi:hypothetical protein